MRQWGFSFDGFGGHGHTVVEVYDRQRGKWLLLDVFNNFHAVDASQRRTARGAGIPKGAARFARRRCACVPTGVAVQVSSKARRRSTTIGAAFISGTCCEGNDVFGYYAHPLVRAAGTAIADVRAVRREHGRREAAHPHSTKPAKMPSRYATCIALRRQLVVLAVASAAASGDARRSASAGLTRSEPPVDSARRISIGLVGPLPPPSGGMANQTRQLARLLDGCGDGGRNRAGQCALSAALDREACAACVPCSAWCPICCASGAVRGAPICSTSWPIPAGPGIFARRRPSGSHACAACRSWSTTGAARPSDFCAGKSPG